MDNFDRVLRAGEERQCAGEVHGNYGRRWCNPLRVSPGRAGLHPPARGVGVQNFAGFFIPQVERLAGWVAHRVVGPGRQPVFSAVDCPGALASRFADHEAKIGITDYIDPGGGCGPARRQLDDVFPPILAETAVAIKEL